MPLSPGQTLNNRYRIVKLLGQGGFGAVYRVWDTHLERPRALKENLDPSADAQRQFKREAHILADLVHPNLPRVMDHFIIQGRGEYLVMDFIEGEDLQQMLLKRAAPLQEREVLAWIGQVCDALIYLHDRQTPIIHRDVKPANIKITPEGQAILVDFGIAKTYTAGQLTTRGAKAVTPGFSPIEQYGGGGQTDARSDLYALGATLYVLLTGLEPPECTQRVLRDDLLPARRINPNISPAMEALLSRALQIDPPLRFQSASDFKAALQSLVSAGAPSATVTNPPDLVIPSTQVVSAAAQTGTAAMGTGLVVRQLARSIFIILAQIGAGLVGLALVIGFFVPGLLIKTPVVERVLMTEDYPEATVEMPLVVETSLPASPTEMPSQTPVPSLTFTPRPTRRIEGFILLPVVPFEAGTFVIVSAYAAVCLDVPYGTMDDIQLIQYGCHRGENQAWTFNNHGDGSYEVVSLASGKCLDVYNWGKEDGEMIYQSECHGGDNQRWQIDLLENGAYQIKARHSGKCLDLPEAGAVENQTLVQSSCDGRESQVWNLQPVPLTLESNNPPLLEGVFTLTSLYSQQCLEVPGGLSEDIQLTRGACDGELWQQWRFTYLGNTLYRLVSQTSGSCLDVYYAGQGDGEMIYQAGCHDGSNQIWDVRRFEDGSYQLRALHSDKCLAMQDGAPQMVQQTCTGGEKQRWNISSPANFSFRLDAGSYAGLTILVRRGQRLVISASGSVTTNPDDLEESCNQWLGPAGLADCHYLDEKPRLMNLPFMGLIGWFQGEWGLFGEYTALDVSQDGWVILTHNDHYFEDNEGFTQVDVSLQSP